MGCRLEQPVPFAQRLENQGKMELLQVTDATVDQFGGFTGGPGGEVALLEKRDRKAGLGRLIGDSRPVDTTAQDDQIDLGCFAHMNNLLK
jgi:hypothetical protein